MRKGAADNRSDVPFEHAAVTVPCPVLVGRSAELEETLSSLDQACRGQGAVMFVLGEAGIGKSRLADETAANAAERGIRVLRGRAVPGSGSAAFRPLTEALAPVTSEALTAADLGPWLPALAPILPAVGSANAIEATAAARGEAVLRLLAAASTPAGGLIVLEDLHWADAETIAIVEHLCDNLHRAPVMCLATVRDEPSAARDLVRRVAARRAAPVLELKRLNEAQVAAMVYSCTGRSDADAVERAVTMADGVPFLVEEMLVSPGLPATFAEGVASRLAELPADARHVLVAAAALGRDFDWRLLGRAAAVAEDTVIESLERGVIAQLLEVEGDRFRFRHALSAEAVFQSVIPPRREAAAAAALAALDEANPEPSAEVLEIAAAVAERAGQRQRAGRLQLALGEEALERGALHTAVAALRRAADVLAQGEEQDRALERLVDALVLAGRADEALTIGGTLAGRLPAERAAAVHLRLAGAAATAARWPVVRGHLAAAGRLVRGAASHRLEAELAIREADLALGTNDSPSAGQRARDALAVARSDGLHDLECEALELLGRDARRYSLEAAEEWFSQMLHAAETHGLAVWRLKALHELGTIGLLERSEVGALIEAQQLAEALGAMATAAVLDIEIAAGFAGLDDFQAEERHGKEAVRRGTDLGLNLVAAYGWMHVGTVAALRGDRDLAASAWASARQAAPGNQDIEAFVIGGELFAALTVDDLERALDLASRMTELLRGSETAPPGHHRAAWPVLLALDGRPEAPAAIEEIEQAGLTVTRGARGWLAMARAILDGRTDHGRAARLAVDADAELAYMPLWRSVARRIAAQAANTDGWQIPDNWLAEAEICLRRLGFGAPADACRRLRGGAPSAVPAAWIRLGVTRREADVLKLVIDGLSNREIGERLYLSARTIEKHVESLLRKTGAKSRTQLARIATST